MIGLNTFLLIFGIYQVVKGNKVLHTRIMSIVVISTLVGVVALAGTVMAGWDYSLLTTPLRMKIHRSFSVPLFVFLVLTALTGFSNQKKWHKIFIKFTLPFWVGTLITGTWFFW